MHHIYLQDKGGSMAGGYFFLGSITRDDQDIQLNGSIHITCAILKSVVALATEAESEAFSQRQRSKSYQANTARVRPSTTSYTNSCR